LQENIAYVRDLVADEGKDDMSVFDDMGKEKRELFN
jgi:hypothetical protein